MIDVGNVLKKAEENIGSSLVTYETISRSAGPHIWVTSVMAKATSVFNWLTDSRFFNKAIVTEPGGLNFDLEATTKAWEGIPGKRPEDFLADGSITDVSLGFDPTNWGRQKGVFGINSGELVLIRNDFELSGTFEVLGLTESGWGTKNIRVNKGQAENQESIKDIKIGFSLPAIVKDRNVVGQMSIWEASDPRAVAQPRDFLDLTAGVQLSPEFLTLVPKFLPNSSETVRRMSQNGKSGVIRVPVSIDEAEIQRFIRIIEYADLGQHWQIIEEQGPANRKIVRAVLPANRIPVMGLGFDDQHRLIVTAVDGNQADSGGATIDELAQIMIDHGAVWAGLGASGGDVAIAATTRTGIKILNSPANTNVNNNQVTREVPSILVIS